MEISRNGFRYFSVFVGEYSSYVWTFHSEQNKDDVFKMFVVLIALIQRQYSTQVKQIRIDQCSGTILCYAVYHSYFFSALGSSAE
jgi:hypothetical protein